MIKIKSFLLLILIYLLFFSYQAFGYSLNGFTGIAKEKDFIAAGVFKNWHKSEFYSGDLLLSYGFKNNFDLTSYSSFYKDDLNDKKGVNFQMLMPRYEILTNHIAALQFVYDNAVTESYIISPQYHYIFDEDNYNIGFVGNIGTNLYFKETKSNSTLFGVIAPVYKFSKSFNIFLEFDPTYQLGGDLKGFYLDLLPGFWIGFADNKYQITAAFMIKKLMSPHHDEKDYGFGLIFSVTF